MTCGECDDHGGGIESETFYIQTVAIVKQNNYNEIASVPGAGKNRELFLKPIPLDNSQQPTVSKSAVSAGGFTAAPTLYVINPTSLAKPHALQHLRADVESNNIDASIINRGLKPAIPI